MSRAVAGERRAVLICTRMLFTRWRRAGQRGAPGRHSSGRGGVTDHSDRTLTLQLLSAGETGQDRTGQDRTGQTGPGQCGLSLTGTGQGTAVID